MRPLLLALCITFSWRAVNIKIEELSRGESGFTLLMKSRLHTFGRAHICIDENMIATLADIKICDFVTRSYSFIPFPKKTYKYQGQGHGSVLLDEVISKCRIRGLRRIEGMIVGNKEMLEKWYEKHGFKVEGGEKIMIELGNA